MPPFSLRYAYEYYITLMLLLLRAAMMLARHYCFSIHTRGVKSLAARRHITFAAAAKNMRHVTCHADVTLQTPPPRCCR